MDFGCVVMLGGVGLVLLFLIRTFVAIENHDWPLDRDLFCHRPHRYQEGFDEVPCERATMVSRCPCIGSQSLWSSFWLPFRQYGRQIPGNSQKHNNDGQLQAMVRCEGV